MGEDEGEETAGVSVVGVWDSVMIALLQLLVGLVEIVVYHRVIADVAVQAEKNKTQLNNIIHEQKN